MRYARVESILEGEAFFKDQMSAKTEAYAKPDGSIRQFSPEVIKVTELLHQAGRDAHKAPKLEILRIAYNLFKIGRNGSAEVNGVAPVVAVVATTAAPAEPVAEPVAAPAPKAEVKPVEAKPAAQPKPKPVAKAPAPKAPMTKKPVVTSKAPEPSPAPAAPAAPAQVPEKPVEAKYDPSLDPAHNPYISMYSLSLSLIQMVTQYDTDSAKDDRLKTLNKLAVDLRKLTRIKEPARAQEIKK